MSFLSKLSFKALVLAYLFSFFLSILIGLLAGIVHGVIFGVPEEIDLNDPASYMTNELYIFSLISGFLAIIAGGWMAARIAQKDPIENAVGVGILGLAFGALMIAYADNPLWFELGSLIVIIPGAYYGGFIWRRKHGKPY